MKNTIAGTSRLTSKAQTVIPKSVRERLGLKPGDRVRYRIAREGIVIEKALDAEDDPFASFSEWSSDADSRAYDSL
jgi:antitoxin PrlF